jgi:hypothetical protein
MLPNYPEPWKKPSKFKEQLSHHLRYFRFAHKTEISTQSDLQLEEFFDPAPLEIQDDHHLLRLGNRRPFKSQEPSKSEPLQLTDLSAESQFLEEAGFQQPKKTEFVKPKEAGRAFLFPTL